MLLYSFVSACSQCLCLHVVDGPSAMSAGYLQTGGGVIACHLDKGVLFDWVVGCLSGYLVQYGERT